MAKMEDVPKLYQKLVTCLYTEWIDSANALGRVLAASVRAPENFPMERTSLKDGYACIKASRSLTIVGESKPGSKVWYFCIPSGLVCCQRSRWRP